MSDENLSPAVPIRLARLADCETIAEIEVSAGEQFRSLGMGSVASDPPPSPSELSSFVAAAQAWVYTVDDRAVAYLLAGVVDGCAHVEQVSVASPFQRRGYGKALLDWVCEWARDSGLSAVTLTTFTEVPWNGPYYARLGFRYLTANEESPGLRAIRDGERARGLDRWPRACMRADVAKRSVVSSDTDQHIAPHLDSSALIVIDTQRDFVDCGSSPIPGTIGVIPKIVGMIEAYRRAGLPIVHVVRLYDDDGDVDRVRRSAIAAGACVVRPGTPGSQVVEGLLPDEAPPLDYPALLAGRVQQVGPREVVLWKPRWSAFHRTPLDAHLASFGVDTVVIVGCNFPNCPRATIFGASERDYRVVFVPDALSGVTSDHVVETASIGAVSMTPSELMDGISRGVG